MSEQINKIALLSSSESWGGLEMNLLRIAEVLRLHGQSIALFLIKDSEIWKRASEAGFEVKAIQGHRKYYDFAKARQLARAFKDEGISTVLFRDNFDMSLLVSTKYLMGNKLKLIYFQGMQLGIAKRGILHTLRFRALDSWLTPLQFLADQAVKLTKIKPEKVHVVPLGRDFNFRKSKANQIAVRNHYGIPGNSFVAGILGRLDPAKGQELLIQSLAFLNNADVHILLQGETTKGEHQNFKNKLELLAKSMNVADRVHFAEFNPNPGDFFDAIDVFVMASKQETFGMATIEALSAGVPVLGSDAGGTPEILQNGLCGTLFKTQDALDLAEKLGWISQNSDSVGIKTQKGLIRAEDFTTKAMYVKLKEHL